ncbi:MAG: T9SS type A sorting domain-containing protein [Cytophagaceae bacterium]|nr:T9SS type A sorting domain-containing protein [Cytophagaceae bacterium]
MKTKLLLMACLFLSVCSFAQVNYASFESAGLVTFGEVMGHGTLDTIANPSMTGVNTSAMVGSYQRSGTQFDVILLDPINTLQDVTPYINGTKQITMKVYNPAANTLIAISLQNEAAAAGAWPAGRLAEFTATTSAVANQWETLTFTYGTAGGNLPGAGATVTNVDQLVILFSPNTTTPYTIRFDDLMGPEMVPLAGVNASSKISASSVYPNPSNGLTHVRFNLTETSEVKVIVSDMMGREIAVVLDATRAGEVNEVFNVAGLTHGLYTINYYINGSPAKSELLMVK